MPGAPVGAVLCGGASRRMGADKATLLVDGVPMARRVADVLEAAGCSPVVTVGGEAAALRRLGLDNVDDEFPGEGPLGGLLTALSVGAPAVVVACDMPRLGVATVTSLIAGLDGHDAAMARSDGPEPMCAIWSQRSVAPLRAQFLAGERAMHRAIVDLDIAWIAVPLADLRNINTPGDLGTL